MLKQAGQVVPLVVFMTVVFLNEKSLNLFIDKGFRNIAKSRIDPDSEK